MYKIATMLAFLLLSVSANAQIRLELGSTTLQIDPHTGKADGIVKLTIGDSDQGPVTLRASPLALGDAYAFVKFKASSADNADVDPKALNCQAKAPCQIPFMVEGAWKTGLYQGTLTAASPSTTPANIALSAVRTPPAFQPILTSEALHGGRFVVDATSQREFVLTVQDAAGARPGEFKLTASADTTLRCTPPGPIEFSPDSFHLEPEASQAVVARVQPCVPSGEHFLVVHIGDPTQAAAGVDTIAAVTVHPAGRAWQLLAGVVFGSIVSVMLNNIFPVSRARTALRANLRQVRLMLHDSGQVGSALLDGLTAEARRIELSLKQVHFFSAGKGNDIQVAQTSVAALTTAAGLARRVGQTRSAAASATLPIIIHAQIRQKLRDAEDALRSGDSQAAGDRLAEAQGKLTEAQNDVQQNALKVMLTAQLNKMMTERGRVVPPPHPAPNAAAPVAVHLEQDPARDPRIREIVAQLALDMAGIGGLDARDLLDVERDLYIADLWTEYAEPRLQADPQHFHELAESLLDSLLRNPKSEQVQTLLDLLRSETTPREIALSLSRNEGWIECDTHPRALQSVDIAFVFTHPALQAVPAAKRLLTYDWNTGDGTTPPPSVDRFSHYFRLRTSGWRIWKSAPQSYNVSVGIRVPFSSHAETFQFWNVVTPRASAADWWRAEPMEIASFVISAAIAVATAFGTQYGSGVPDEVTWSALLSAFMLGFGLDQLRDTISPAAASIPVANPAAAATPAAAHPAAHPGA